MLLLTTVNGHAINEISLRILHCIVSSEEQFETWWRPSARAETCCLSNKYSTTLLVVFWLHYPIPSYWNSLVFWYVERLDDWRRLGNRRKLLLLAHRTLKGVPLHTIKAYVGAEVEPQSFLSSGLDWGEWSTSRPGRFTPLKEDQVPTKQEAGSAPETTWRPWKKKKSIPPAGNQTTIPRTSSL